MSGRARWRYRHPFEGTPRPCPQQSIRARDRWREVLPHSAGRSARSGRSRAALVRSGSHIPWPLTSMRADETDGRQCTCTRYRFPGACSVWNSCVIRRRSTHDRGATVSELRSPRLSANVSRETSISCAHDASQLAARRLLPAVCGSSSDRVRPTNTASSRRSGSFVHSVRIWAPQRRLGRSVGARRWSVTSVSLRSLSFLRRRLHSPIVRYEVMMSCERCYARVRVSRETVRASPCRAWRQLPTPFMRTAHSSQLSAVLTDASRRCASGDGHELRRGARRPDQRGATCTRT